MRIGADGPFRIGLNEVNIGLTVPWFAIELARHRLHPSSFDRTVVNATMYGPHDAVNAGFLDQVVPAHEIRRAGLDAAKVLAELDPSAHAATKLRARGQALRALRGAIESELVEP
jgi:enoyl-CoA hydratase